MGKRCKEAGLGVSCARSQGKKRTDVEKKLEENHIFGETKNIVDIVHMVRQRLKETGVGSGRT